MWRTWLLLGSTCVALTACGTNGAGANGGPDGSTHDVGVRDSRPADTGPHHSGSSTGGSSSSSTSGSGTGSSTGTTDGGTADSGMPGGADAGSFGAGNNWYVRPGGTTYGTGSGADWSNAWSGFGKVNTAACGDNVWIAGGTYTGALTINKSCTAGAKLYVVVVRSTDAAPTAAAGYSDTYAVDKGGQVVINYGGTAITLSNASSVWLDGRQCSPEAGVVCGIQTNYTTTTGGWAASVTGGADSTIAHVEIKGNPCIPAATPPSASCGSGAGLTGLFMNGATVTNLLLDHMWFHDWAEHINESTCEGCTIQHSVFNTSTNDQGEHEDIVYNEGVNNLTMRYNRIWQSGGDGIFFDNYQGNRVRDGFFFYGNVIYSSGGQMITCKSVAGSPCTHFYIYNNVFETWCGLLGSGPNTPNAACGFNGEYAPGTIDMSGTTTASVGAIENNVLEDVEIGGAASSLTVDYNAYSTGTVTQGGSYDHGAHTIHYTCAMNCVDTFFVNEPNNSNSGPDSPTLMMANFHLTSSGAAELCNGVALASPYDVDPDGNPRGSHSCWNLGAYQH